MAELYTARSLADTLQTVVDGALSGLGYQLAAVNLVRPDGDLVVAAFAGDPRAEEKITGRIGSRSSWERRLTMGEDWAGLRFIPHAESRVLTDDVPEWHREVIAPVGDEGAWHAEDRLYAPMYASGGELLGVISVDHPSDGRRPEGESRAALRTYAFHSAVAISNARLRANMQHALVRLEREQQALRANEESFRQAFEYAPSGIAIAEMGGDQHGRLLRTNDALCRLLGRPASVLRRYAFVDLVHPEDIGTLLRTPAEGGRAELRLNRRDGTYVWVSLRNSVVADAADGPRFLLTHIEDIDGHKDLESELLRRASLDDLTGLLNESEVRVRLGERLCDGTDPADRPDGRSWDDPDPYPVEAHQCVGPPSPSRDNTTLAVLRFGLDGFKAYNARHGRAAGDAALRHIADRLSRELHAQGHGGNLGRVRGDEFVVIAPGLDHRGADALEARLRKVCRSSVRAPGTSGGGSLDVTGSVSWAACGLSAERVLERSGELLHERKLRRSAPVSV
ncbi:diguanylate cyclase domain-containing protein [Streptomyces virginiae]|uniref:sensor domain-containing diguanylate cyclase n=1 Tax=Streptomyces virginiae TaxID=1961 RepID=UPI0035DA7AC5